MSIRQGRGYGADTVGDAGAVALLLTASSLAAQASASDTSAIQRIQDATPLSSCRRTRPFSSPSTSSSARRPARTSPNRPPLGERAPRPPSPWRWQRRKPPCRLEQGEHPVLAAGDVRHGSIKRVSAGVGEGSIAIAVVHQYLAELRAVPLRSYGTGGRAGDDRRLTGERPGSMLLAFP